MSDIELKSDHMEILKHMLGADSRYKKKQWGFRNHYCAGPDDFSLLDEMIGLGLLTNGTRIFNTDKYYYATRAGAIAVGFKPYQLRNAGL